MTNSAKYAHYGPATIGREIRFGNLRQCGGCMQRECAETEAFLVGLVQGNPLSDLLISKRYILSNT
jgi:hypothetical protein